MDKMEIDKKSNFSSINPTNGAIVRGGSGNSNAKGDIKKLVIKNFKCKLRFFKRNFFCSLNDTANGVNVTNSIRGVRNSWKLFLSSQANSTGKLPGKDMGEVEGSSCGDSDINTNRLLSRGALSGG
jgi:hypothetical protein